MVGAHMQGITYLFLSFCAYSFLGWLCETVYCSLPKGAFVNRGFLAGPVCPVYGFGALAVIYLLAPLARAPLVLFCAAMLLTSALEYATGFLLETLFHTKWWDYSSRRFHLHGRVCLLNSLLFGCMATLVVLWLNPAVQRLLHRLGLLPAGLLASGLAVWLCIDLVATVRGILSLEKMAAQLAAAKEELQKKTEAHKEALRRGMQKRLERLPGYEGAAELRESIGKYMEFRAEGREERKSLILKKLEKAPAGTGPWKEGVRELLEKAARPELGEELRALAQATNARLQRLRDETRHVHRRLLRAFPHMRSVKYEGALEQLREAAQKKRQGRGSRG